MPWEKQFDVEAAMGRAMKAFWSKGFEATSTQDLLDAMNINRGSLYDTYGNKRRLFLDCLEHYDACYQKPRMRAASRDRSPRETIRALFDMLAAGAAADGARRGCFLVNTALDLAPHDPEIAALVERHLSDIEAFFRTEIEDGKRAGEFSPDLDAGETSRGLLGLVLGIGVLARSRPDASVLAAVARQATKILS